MRQPGNRFVSCVRCEAVCTRETMLFPSLGLAAVNSGPARARACRALLRGRAFPWLCSLLSSSLLNSATSVCLEVVISIEFTWIEFILLILWSCRCSTGAVGPPVPLVPAGARARAFSQ